MLKAKVSKTGYENTDKSSEDLQNAIDKLAGEKSTVFKDARETKILQRLQQQHRNL